MTKNNNKPIKTNNLKAGMLVQRDCEDCYHPCSKNTTVGIILNVLHDNVYLVEWWRVCCTITRNKNELPTLRYTPNKIKPL